MSRHHRLLAAYPSLMQSRRPLVMATIIETFGSTYQKAGARLLIGQNGELTGLLGGGCFERDLIEHAKILFETGGTKTLFYDMRATEDALWGLGLGCNGAARIFLQTLVADDGFGALGLLVQAAEAEQTATLATVVESDHPDFPTGFSRLLPFAGGLSAWPLTHPLLPQRAGLENQQIAGHSVAVFYEPVRTPTHLLVLGAGDDAIPLLAGAKALGWRVTVADQRPAYLEGGRFAGADCVCTLQAANLAERLQLHRFSACVVMSHNIEHDQRYLAALAESEIPYVGLLGPARRRQRLLDRLPERLAAKLQTRLFGPVGLDIGAETPEEIALAIVAAIQAVLKGRRGGLLAQPDDVGCVRPCNA
ncbi:XdhC family protein [Methylomonas koyamae]|uniref:Xanthine dehydrogenase n=1 Tax=Methylomonas koyamae TaxID=702114 RepID=A0AA91DAB4_9GAMM|nr:XdhC/CoxI family protein [Methylomonas koyamae]OAI23332.1 hypothetical protein A1356_17690 [Methylomonas koyamae]